MITCDLKAGFGNQQFSYAITRAVAEYNGYEWGFNPIPEYDMPHNYQGVPQFDFFDIDYGKQNSYKSTEFIPGINHFWSEHVEEHSFSDGEIFRFFPYQPEIFGIPDNTRLYVSNCQDARYFEPIKDRVREWFRIKQENIVGYKQALFDFNIVLDDNFCAIHVRGKDFCGDTRILLPLEYYQNAMDIMLKKNPKMKFGVLTDDVNYGKLLFGNSIPVMQNELGCDYYIFNVAKNVILSNSSFTLFPTWLSENQPDVIAPRYWWRYNNSRGWLSSDVWSFGYKFLDKDGLLYDK